MEMTVYEGRGCGDFGYDILSSTSDQNQYFVAVSKAAYDNGTTVVTDLETPSPQMKRKIWGPSTPVALGLVGASSRWIRFWRVIYITVWREQIVKKKISQYNLSF